MHTLGVAAGLAAGLALAGCHELATPASPASVSGAVTAAAAPAPHDIGGVWVYTEETRLTLPGALAADLGAASEGPVLHVRCTSADGQLTLAQTGSTFTGTLEYQSSVCRTQGGQAVSPPWPLPYRAVLSGQITGRALHIEQYDDPPGPPDAVRCPKNGQLRVQGGVVTQLSTTGRCDLSGLPFQPAVATNSGVAMR
jgi:hypothetical protein